MRKATVLIALSAMGAGVLLWGAWPVFRRNPSSMDTALTLGQG
jgi:hypothetical protein